jgi:uncharacterized RDD family membrane protein YckC
MKVFSPVKSFLKAFILWQLFQSIDAFSVSPYTTGVWLFASLATSIIFSILLKRPTELIYGIAIIVWVSLIHRFNGFLPLLYFIWSFYRFDKMNSQDVVQIDDSTHSSGAIKFGGFWRRGMAYSIDWCIFILFLMPISVAVGGLNADVQPVNPYHQWIHVAFVLVMWIILSMMESSIYRATLGKRALGLRVVSLSGNRLSFTTALMRNFIKIPLWGVPEYLLPISESWVWGLLLVGQIAIFFTAIFSSKKQTVYDMLVKTLVVR